MTTASFFQQLLPLPPQESVPALHRTVYRTLLKENEARDFVYILLDYPLADQMAVLARSVRPRADWHIEQVSNGDIYDFEVTCDIRVWHSGGKTEPDHRRRRHGPKDQERRMKWFRRQADRGGFTLLDAYEARHSLYLRLVIQPGLNEQIFATTFTGRLLVTEATRFAEELTTGFGKSMTYGLGMMLLRPVVTAPSLQ